MKDPLLAIIIMHVDVIRLIERLYINIIYLYIIVILLLIELEE
jgi:hypothetical protein